MLIDKALLFLSNHTTVAIVAAATTAALGIPFVSGMFVSPQSTYLLREYNLEWRDKQAETRVINSFEDFPLVNVSFKSLIGGNKSYNQGNYVIYFGSERCPYCNALVYDHLTTTPPNKDKQNHYRTSKWHKAYKWSKYADNPGLKSLKFLMFSDQLPKHEKRSDDQLNVLPWAQWGTNDLAAGKIATDYIRNDQSAINFRRFRDALMTKFGPKKVKYIPTVIVYKNGVPKVFGEDEFPELSAKWKHREEKAKQQDANQNKDTQKELNWEIEVENKLYEYIEYYFTSKNTRTRLKTTQD